jgi:hypothetical protein
LDSTETVSTSSNQTITDYKYYFAIDKIMTGDDTLNSGMKLNIPIIPAANHPLSDCTADICRTAVLLVPVERAGQVQGIVI